MPNAARPSFLRHFARAAATRRGPDLGDMGTAFALEHTLDEAPFELPSGAPAFSARAVPPPAWRNWLGRKRR